MRGNSIFFCKFFPVINFTVGNKGAFLAQGLGDMGNKSVKTMAENMDVFFRCIGYVGKEDNI